MRYITLCVLTANIITFIAAANLGWASPVLEKLKDPATTVFNRPVTNQESSWIGSIISLGAIFGPYIYGYAADKFGRKPTMLCLAFPFIIGQLMYFFGETVLVYCAARFIIGIAVGGTFTLMPIYIGEIAADDERGILSSFFSVFLTVGTLWAFYFGRYTSINILNAVLLVLPIIFVILFYYICSESQHYLIKKGQLSEAETVLQKIRGSQIDIHNEIKQTDIFLNEMGEGSFLDIFKSKPLIKAFVVGFGLITFQQMSGINAMIFYAEAIVKGVKGINVDVSFSLVGLAQIFAIIITPPVADKFNRKAVLLFSGIGMIISQVPLGYYYFDTSLHDVDIPLIQWMPILCIMTNLIAYTLGFSAIVWTMMAEIFPSNVKSQSNASMAATCWLFGFLTTKFFEPLSILIGMGVCFWIFSGFCAAAVIFVHFYVIETKANILGLITGMSVSWSSSSIPKLRKYYETPDYPFEQAVTENTLSWISSLLQLGAVFGAVIFGVMSYKLGRKITIACIGVPFIIAYILLAFSWDPYLYMAGRTIAGLSVGGTFMVLPTYIGEVCHQFHRGRLTSSTTSFTFFGLFLSYCIGPFLKITTYNLIIASIAALFIPLFVCVAPETPYYLLSVNRFSDALKSFTKLRGYDDRGISKELEYIESNLKKCQEGPVCDIFTDKNSLKALFITTGLVSIQQLSGINLILQRDEKLFDMSGIQINHKVCPIIVGGVLFATSYITPIICDKVGRRLLFFISSTGAFLCLASLGFYFYAKECFDDGTKEVHWIPLLCLVLYICFYNCGLGALPWAVMGELFPMHIKSVGSAICTSVYWLIGFWLNQYFTPLREDVGMGTAIWLFSGFCIIMIIFVFLFLFETKGKTLEEIQDILQQK